MKTTTPLFIGSTGYFVSRGMLKRIKECCKIANIPWQTIAARPSEAESFCKQVEMECMSLSRYQTGK